MGWDLDETVAYLTRKLGDGTERSEWDVLANNHITDVGVGVREYGDTEAVFVSADWNRIPEKVGRRLEDEGVECLWLDEWATCSGCYMAVRTNPDSYGWQPQFIWGDGEILCLVCVAETMSADDILYGQSMYGDDAYVNNPSNALTEPLLAAVDWTLEGEGFTLVSGRNESGWHPGMDADPKAIFESLKDEWDEIVFALSDVSQFYVTFDVYGRMKKEDDE